MTAPAAARFSPAQIAELLGQFPPTSEQAAVISAPLGPALVVAGAGSGKTETMAGRVVWLVANGLVRPDQILGLTFTRKAAGELAERIRHRLARWAQVAPAGTAAASADGVSPASDPLLDRPTVSTYNSFADQVVRDNAVRIGRDPDTAVLSESAAWLLMRRVVLDADDERLEQREEALTTIIDAALRIARDGVDNLVDLDELARFPDRFADVLLRPSESPKTTVYADVAKAAQRVGGLGVLADLAAEYRRRKVRLGVIDFSDQVAGALEAVRAHPAVAADLRDRFRVVLLDEYQDTSVVQTDLLSEVFAGSAVMAVGDPHQSIYGWRGASAGNLGDFARAFAPDGDARTYALLTSWRNSTRVLDAAGAVLAPLSAGSPVPVEPLRARPGAPDGVVDIVFATDVQAEADAVADWFVRVRERRRAAGEVTTGAILFRSKKHMTRFGDALAARGVPHRILGLGGLLTTPEVVDVVSALRVISDPHAGSALLRLLAGPRWAVGLPDLRALAALARRRGDAADGASLIDALEALAARDDDRAADEGFSVPGLARLREAQATFDTLRRSVGLPIPELVRLIERELRLDIELAANEARGPARIASAQLRAFVDELQGFLQTDGSGSLSSLLAWLDRAEKLDEFAPRTEPAEEDVVQLLTIHGSKGLEWDVVAVARCVEDELPSRPRDLQGWLGFGVLPYAFRGDAAWLPELGWDAAAAATQQDLRAAIARFRDDNAARHLAEERRLAYVAITRARDALLLSGSSWAGQKSPRGPGVFLHDIVGALSLDIDLEVEPGDDPFQGERRTLAWPLDPLGERRTRVEAAATAVRAAQSAQPAAPSADLALLLAERDAHAAGRTPRAPTRIAASRYKDFVTDYDGTVRALERPLPERPYRQTRLGTLFHAWVERRSGLAGHSASPDDALWEVDEDQTGGSDADDAALDRLKTRFLASEWAHLQPLEVEAQIEFADDTLLPDGRPHVVVCKLDAVYRRDDRGGRIEIVDWKTGRAPRTADERAERMLQLELYRRAYHVKHAVPLDEIDVALYYVADDLVLRG